MVPLSLYRQFELISSWEKWLPRWLPGSVSYHQILNLQVIFLVVKLECSRKSGSIIMAANALAPCIARSSAALEYIMQDEQVNVFHGEQFQLPLPCVVKLQKHSLQKHAGMEALASVKMASVGPQLISLLCWDFSQKWSAHWGVFVKAAEKANVFFIFSCDQAALRTFLSVRPSVCPSNPHTFFTMFPSYHEIFRIDYQWQKWCPCKESRSEVKGQGHRGQNPI